MQDPFSYWEYNTKQNKQNPCGSDIPFSVTYELYVHLSYNISDIIHRELNVDFSGSMVVNQAFLCTLLNQRILIPRRAWWFFFWSGQSP